MPDPAQHAAPAPAPHREQQVAALCCRDGKDGPEILLITSRDTGRWVLPKGWPMEGKTLSESALEEAWEEAGIRAAAIASVPLGHYHYDKRMNDGTDLPVTVALFRLDVSDMADDFPEKGQRQLQWMPPAMAADNVDEPGLRDILRGL